MFNKLNRCTLALMLLTSSMSFSALPTKVVDPNYEYFDDDILNVIENRVGNNNPNIHIVPIYPINAPDEFVEPAAMEIANNLNNGKVSLIYNNLGGHWTASVIRKDASGAATLYYNDPNGGSYTSTSLLKVIRTLRPDIQLRDLQIHQQSDGTSCGAFTAEDLVVLAEMNDDELTLESARALLSNIKDAQMLRNKHAGIVTQENREEVTKGNREDVIQEDREYDTQENIKYVTQENREYFEDEDKDKEEVFNSAKDKKFVEQLRKALPGSDAEKFGNSLDELIEEQQVKEAFSKLTDRPKERNSEIIRAALRHALTDTHNSAMSAIHSRLSNGPLVVAAGDDDVAGDTWQHGVWARASISHSKDKASNKTAEYFSGYKTKGHSNTIGVDTLINDNLLLGLAYTNAYTSIKPQNQNAGNVDKARTNMFSLYSSYNIPNYNWFVDGTISYAESVIRGKNVRNGNEVASSKYKSHLYSGSVSLGYNYHTSNDIYITPSLGMTGSLIKDSGYKETGTNFQNLNVAKKHYNKLSSTLGVRTFKNINQGKLTITPELYSFVNYSLKNKTPSVNAQLQGIDETLPTINFKSNKVDYNLGFGLSLKHNMMEYGINYTATFAKKYEAHSGSLKVRVNF
ncbi:autotransporter outer membrane beta-barrel domain-containing protein [Rickettsia bellii]|uniref:Outer membrane autotransporter barrel domain protein n=1 Tax=Rickettsia bellii str. RML An4 TaxID=1359193 RepID=A0A0F3QE89_RICBE|nr:autotransporter outer membrane beta-barrel domain-containing protein [Rickettsia bellii]ARD86611.1 autotransporter outer membrane beta-barrel domain-containing protein [Rickettsia bellii]KJV89744.1 outer membrane autotransporter barrel domain protein [Rickettsia bellii str. RML An4]